MTKKRQNKKQLSLTAMKSTYRDINRYKEHVWDAETNTIIKYYDEFDKNKIEELLVELYQDIEYAENENLSFFHDDANMMKYTSLLIIKHFTHLKKSIPEELDKKIQYMKEMIGIGLVELMFDELFLEEEVQQVFEKIVETATLAERVTQEMSRSQEKLDDFLANSENLSQLANLKKYGDEVMNVVHPSIREKIEQNENI